MWIEIKKAQTLAVAEMWKECFEGEGVPARIMPMWKLKLPMVIQLTSGTAIRWSAEPITEKSAQMENTAEAPIEPMAT